MSYAATGTVHRIFDRLFKLERNATTVKTELAAGLTTFMTMAYILAVNPQILSAAGIPMGGVFVATALAATVGTGRGTGDLVKHQQRKGFQNGKQMQALRQFELRP